MNIPKIGDIITVNFDVEIEEEDGFILRLEAGEEMKVLGYDDLTNHVNADGSFYTPEQYFAEWEAIELIVECADIHVQHEWDRSGQSDYEVSGREAYISVGTDSGLTIVSN
jgi:hypothetical protein